MTLLHVVRRNRLQASKQILCLQSWCDKANIPVTCNNESKTFNAAGLTSLGSDSAKISSRTVFHCWITERSVSRSSIRFSFPADIVIQSRSRVAGPGRVTAWGIWGRRLTLIRCKVQLIGAREQSAHTHTELHTWLPTDRPGISLSRYSAPKEGREGGENKKKRLERNYEQRRNDNWFY